MNKYAVAQPERSGTSQLPDQISSTGVSARTGIPLVRPRDAPPLDSRRSGISNTSANSLTTNSSTSSASSTFDSLSCSAAAKRFHLSEEPDSSSSSDDCQSDSEERTSSDGERDSAVVPNRASSQSRSPAHTPSVPAYAIRNDVQNIRKEKKAAWRRALDTDTPLTAAIKAKEWDKVQELAKSGVDLNRQDTMGFTPLHLAALLGYVLAAHALLDNGANRDTTSREGYTALMLAASKRHLRMVQLLADGQQDLNKSTITATAAAATSGPTAYGHPKLPVSQMLRADRVETFKAAIIGRDLVMAALLLAAGNVQISDCDGNGMPPLVLGAIAGDRQMIRLLLCNGAKISKTDTQGKSPLMHAAECRHLDIIDLLLHAGADAGQTDIHGNTALSLAVGYDDVEVLDALLGCRNGGGKLHAYMPVLLRNAALAGNTDAVKKLLDRKADLPDAGGNLALAAMACTNQLAAFSTLLQAGADPHHKAWDGNTAFTLAAANGHMQIVKALFQYLPSGLTEADWIKRLQQETDNGGRTAFILAVLNRHHSVFSLLLGKRPDHGKRDLNGRTALLWAAAGDDRPLVNALIEYPESFVVDIEGNSVFLAAAKYGSEQVIKLLLEKAHAKGSTNIHTPNKAGDTPLIAAARNGHLHVVKLLLEKNANCLHRNQLGRTALMEAAAYTHTKVMALLQHHEKALPMAYPAMEALIKNVIRAVPLANYLMPELQSSAPNQTDHSGNSMLHLIAEHGHAPGLDQLLAAPSESMGPVSQNIAHRSNSQSVVLNEISADPILLRPALFDMETRNKEGLTPLCIAVRKGHYAMATLMLKQGAQVNHASADGISPLWFACRLDKCMADHGDLENKAAFRPFPVDMVALLLEHGALVDDMSFRSQTPLMAASVTGDPAVVLQLIRAGAKVDRMDIDKLTPLMYAANHGHTHIATMLLDEGAEPDQQEGQFSALIVAAEAGHDNMVKLLVKRGAQKNHANISGSTALIVASANGRVSTTKLLIGFGADLSIRNKAGRDAMHYAKAGNHLEVVDLLRRGYPEPQD